MNLMGRKRDRCSHSLSSTRVSSFLLLPQGDNIYEDGVESVADPLWTSRYCSVYTDPSLLDIPWYAILGTCARPSGYVLLAFPLSLPPALPSFFLPLP